MIPLRIKKLEENKKTFLFVIATVISLVTVSFASATTLEVCPSGCIYSTIQAAIDAASPGDTIQVNVGTYNENLIINKTLTLLGPNAGINPNTQTRNPEAIISKETVPGGQNLGIVNIATSTASNVTFDGFEVRTESNASVKGIEINGADNVTVENTIVHYMAGTLIYPNYANFLTVENCTLYDNSGFEAIKVSSSLSSPHTCNDVTIKNNNIYNTGSGVWVYYGSRWTIENNTIHDLGDFGINVDNGGDHVVRDNIIYNVVNAGIKAEKNSTIIHNTIFGVSGTQSGYYGSGIAVKGTFTGGTIEDNIIVSSLKGIYFRTDYPPFPTVTIDYNDVWNNTYGDYVNGFTAGAHDISADPLFVNSTDPDLWQDFDLSCNPLSPCRGVASDETSMGAVQSECAEDTTAPDLIIISPENETYNTNTFLVNITISPDAENVWFFNGTDNETYTSEIYRTFLEGSNTLCAYANDSLGNLNETSVTFSVDTTVPTFTKLENKTVYDNESLSYKAVEADDSGSGLASLSVNNANFSITEGFLTNTTSLEKGSYTLTISAIDLAGNTATGNILLTVLGLTQQHADEQTEIISNDTTELVINPGSNSLEEVVVPTNVSSDKEIKLNLIALQDSSNNNTVILGSNNLSLVRKTSSYDYTAIIPASVIIDGGTSWDGLIILPTIKPASDYSAPSGGVDVVVDLGSNSTELNFSKAVKIILGGMAGKKAAWTRGGATLTEITTLCNNLIDPTNINIPEPRECYINSGSDLTIWTYHFTEFAAYTPSSGSSGGAGGGGCTYKWNCTNWSECLPSGKQTRNCTNIGTCSDTYKTPEIEQNCTYTVPEVKEEDKELEKENVTKKEGEKQEETEEIIPKKEAETEEVEKSSKISWSYMVLAFAAALILVVIITRNRQKKPLRKKQRIQSPETDKTRKVKT